MNENVNVAGWTAAIFIALFAYTAWLLCSHKCEDYSEKIVEVIVEKVVEVEVPGPERIVEVEVPGPERIVEVEVPGPERVVEVEVEKIVEVIVHRDIEGPERIVEVEKIVEVEVPGPERIVEVEKTIEVEVPTYMPVDMQLPAGSYVEIFDTHCGVPIRTLVNINQGGQLIITEAGEVEVYDGGERVAVHVGSERVRYFAPEPQVTEVVRMSDYKMCLPAGSVLKVQCPRGCWYQDCFPEGGKLKFDSDRNVVWVYKEDKCIYGVDLNMAKQFNICRPVSIDNSR